MRYLMKKRKKLFFMEYFFIKYLKNDGFDLIIANPPYIKEYTDRDAFTNKRP